MRVLGGPFWLVVPGRVARIRRRRHDDRRCYHERATLRFASSGSVGGAVVRAHRCPTASASSPSRDLPDVWPQRRASGPPHLAMSAARPARRARARSLPDTRIRAACSELYPKISGSTRVHAAGRKPSSMRGRRLVARCRRTGRVWVPGATTRRAATRAVGPPRKPFLATRTQVRHGHRQWILSQRFPELQERVLQNLGIAESGDEVESSVQAIVLIETQVVEAPRGRGRLALTVGSTTLSSVCTGPWMLTGDPSFGGPPRSGIPGRSYAFAVAFEPEL